ncbi:hypothetical protein J6590_045888 [Homalodisca vitripennis]|nr:hypothetical protein J6590_045888 [Homalodisca vitripennis]
MAVPAAMNIFMRGLKRIQVSVDCGSASVSGAAPRLTDPAYGSHTTFTALLGQALARWPAIKLNNVPTAGNANTLPTSIYLSLPL